MKSKVSWIAFLAVMAIGLLAAGVAWATIPDGSGMIHACDKTVGGQLRAIDPGTGGTCLSSETALNWPQTPAQGLQGIQGVQGIKGIDGPQGPDGPLGVAGITQDPQTMVVFASAQGDPQVGGFFKHVDCPQGTKVLWGDWQWQLFISPKPPIDMVSYPSGDTGWNYAVSASNESKGVTVWFFVGCAVAR